MKVCTFSTLFLQFFVFSFVVTFSADFQFPTSVKSISQIVKELPANYDTSSTLIADLNSDGLSDYVVIVSNSKNPIKLNSLVYLAVYLGTSTKMFDLIIVSTKAVLPKSFGTNSTFPFSGMTFEKKLLSIFHYFGDSKISSYEDSYQWKNNSLLLIKSVNSNIDAENDMMTVTETIRWDKGTKEISSYNFHQKFKSKNTKFPIKELVPITKHIPGTIYN